VGFVVGDFVGLLLPTVLVIVVVPVVVVVELDVA
jgi:hypothetical protein